VGKALTMPSSPVATVGAAPSTCTTSSMVAPLVMRDWVWVRFGVRVTIRIRVRVRVRVRVRDRARARA
jgi:hypothetical protein